jgi:hypothetical protein
MYHESPARSRISCYQHRGCGIRYARLPTSASSHGCCPEKIQGEGFSSDAVDLFMAATRDSTNSAYGSVLLIWSDWCVGRGTDPLSNDVTGSILPRYFS